MIKKIVILSSILVATLGLSIVTAGGAYPEVSNYSAFYAGLDVGGVYNTELAYKVGNTDFPNIGRKNTPWGWTASTLVGYQLDKRWALQFGYIWYQNQKLLVTSTSGYTYKRYNLYLAIKLLAPLASHLSAYILVGPAYSNNDITAWGGASSDGQTHVAVSKVTPMGAVGIAYRITQNFNCSLQYLFIMANTRAVQTTKYINNHLAADANTQRLTVGINYIFNL